MSELFSAYSSDISSTHSASAPSSDEATVETEGCSTFSKRQEKVLKKIRKVLKKQKKVLKEMRQQKGEKKGTEKAGIKEAKGFFREIGKAICKAIPAVLTTLTTMAFNFIFMRKRKNGKSGLQFA